MKDFNCTVTSTWTNNEDSREFHTWLGWGSRGRKKQLDYIMGPKNLLNQGRIRTWELEWKGEKSNKEACQGLGRVDARFRRRGGQVPGTCALPPKEQEKFCVAEEIMASNAAKCRDPVRKTLAQDCPESSARIRGGKAVSPEGR